jgi:hypothetical protein
MALVSFGTGLLPAAEFNDQAPVLSGRDDVRVVEPTDIGIGRPLAIRILSIYTGDPPRHFPFQTPRLLVSSRAKHDNEAAAAPRAINLLTSETGRRKRMHGILGQGSRVIYYTPAYTGGMLNVGVELVSDTFPDTLFASVSKLLGAAAALPVFAPAQLALVGATVFTRSLNGLERRLESPPFLADDDVINFDVAGAPARRAGYIVFVNAGQEPALSRDHEVGTVAGFGGAGEVALVHRQTRQPYGGEVPYVIAYADGAADPTLAAFTPLQASAALIQSFYRSGESDGQLAMQILTQGMALYNDSVHARRAREEAAELAKHAPGSVAYNRSLQKLEAFIANVQSEDFRNVLAALQPGSSGN